MLHHIIVRSPIPLPRTLHWWQAPEYVRWVEEHYEEVHSNRWWAHALGEDVRGGGHSQLTMLVFRREDEWRRIIFIPGRRARNIG
jgi:hypothetical protein